ncbi:hypothetical protein J6S88_04600 [bacterium]|nr:hypothetical protein [bacterium]
MDFLKKLFKNENTIIGLCGIESDSPVIQNIIKDYRELNYKPTVDLEFENRKIFRHMFVE